MRIVLDSGGSAYVTAAQIDCLKFAYLNGPDAWDATQAAAQREKGQLLGLIDQAGTSPAQAAIVSWTAMSPKDADRLRWWVEQRQQQGQDAVVSCVRDALPAVLAILTGAYFRLLVDDPSTAGDPPLQAPDYGLPPNAALLGVRYAGPPLSGGPYSLSILFDDSWHADLAGPGAAAALHATAADVDPVVSPVEAQAADELAAHATAARELLEQGAEANPKAGPASSGPPSPASASPTSPEPGPAWSASPSPAPQGAHAAPATQSDSRETLLGPPGPRPFAPDVEASPGSPKPINHGAVYQWILQGREIATAFHAAGVPGTADTLDVALDHLLEVGKLLSELGR